MMDTRPSGWWLTPLALLLCSCDSKHAAPSPDVTVRGVVTTDSGVPIPEARVALMGLDASAVSDANGNYVVVAKQAKVGTSAAVLLSHPSYSPLTTRLDLTHSNTRYDFKLRPHGIETTVTLPATETDPPATVAVPGAAPGDGGATLRIAAGDLALPSGAAAVGNALVKLTYWGPGSSLESAPAPLLGVTANANDPAVGLYSYGMVNIEVTQGSDALQVAAQKTLTLDFHKPQAVEPNVLGGIDPNDAVAPHIWYADPNTGRWTEAGSLASGALEVNPNDLTMQAHLPHLSSWNVDAQAKTNMCLTGKVIDDCNGTQEGRQYSLWILSRGGELVVFTVKTDASGTYSLNIDGATRYEAGKQSYDTDFYAWISGFEQPGQTECNPMGIDTYSALCTKRGWPPHACAGWEYSADWPHSGQYYPIDSDKVAKKCNLPLQHQPMCGYVKGTLNTTAGGRCQAWANGRIVGGPPMVEGACGVLPTVAIPGCGSLTPNGDPCAAANAKGEGDPCLADVDCCPNASLECADGLCVPKKDAG